MQRDNRIHFNFFSIFFSNAESGLNLGRKKPERFYQIVSFIFKFCFLKQLLLDYSNWHLINFKYNLFLCIKNDHIYNTVPSHYKISEMFYFI